MAQQGDNKKSGDEAKQKQTYEELLSRDKAREERENIGKIRFEPIQQQGINQLQIFDFDSRKQNSEMWELPDINEYGLKSYKYPGKLTDSLPDRKAQAQAYRQRMGIKPLEKNERIIYYSDNEHNVFIKGYLTENKEFVATHIIVAPSPDPKKDGSTTYQRTAMLKVYNDKPFVELAKDKQFSIPADDVVDLPMPIGDNGIILEPDDVHRLMTGVKEAVIAVEHPQKAQQKKSPQPHSRPGGLSHGLPRNMPTQQAALG